MPRYKETEREQMKEEIRARLLAAAEGEFAARGYAGANINRISESAGYAQGTVYNYFPGKRALFEAVLLGIAGRHSALVLQGAAAAPDPATRLERFFAAGFAFAEGFPTAAQVVVRALQAADPEIRAVAERAYEGLRSYVRDEIVLSGLQERSFRPVDARLATAMILAVYLSGCQQGEEGAAIRRQGRAVAGLLLEGLRGKETV